MFNWFRRQKDNSNTLHGVDLNTWNYLGYTELFYVSSDDGNTEAKGVVFGFVNKKTKQRLYKVLGSTKYHCFKTHNWVCVEAELWKIGERELWEIAKTEPSEYLKNYMNVKWNNGQWSEHTEKPIVHVEEGTNVVRLEFKSE